MSCLYLPIPKGS